MNGERQEPHKECSEWEMEKRSTIQKSCPVQTSLVPKPIPSLYIFWRLSVANQTENISSDCCTIAACIAYSAHAHKVGNGTGQLASTCKLVIAFLEDKMETSKGWLNPVQAGRASVLA